MEAQNGGAPVILNVYDLTPTLNKYLYWFGLGFFHSGIEVHGSEYAFGAHDLPTSGIFEVEPKSCPGYVYRRLIWMGTTALSREEFRSFIEDFAGKYSGNTYHLISKNCNNFTDDVCKNITKKSAPGWVNRLQDWVNITSFIPYLPDLLGTIVCPTIIGDSDVDELDQHLLDDVEELDSIDVSPTLSKDLL